MKYPKLLSKDIAYTRGRALQLQHLLKWWNSDFKGIIYDLGCKRSEMTWLLSQVADHVYCWDVISSWKSYSDSFKSDKITWVKPHHVPTVDTAYLAGVLHTVTMYHDCAAWIDKMVNWVDSPVWIFREVLDDWQDPHWPYSLESPGWAKTQEALDRCTTLRITDVKTVSLPDHLSDASPQRFFRCERK